MKFGTNSLTIYRYTLDEGGLPPLRNLFCLKQVNPTTSFKSFLFTTFNAYLVFGFRDVGRASACFAVVEKEGGR